MSEGVLALLKANSRLANIGIYLGPDKLDERRQLPKITIVPTAEDVGGNARYQIAGRTETGRKRGWTMEFHCDAAKYEDARALAYTVLDILTQNGALAPGAPAQIRYETYPPARTAVLTVSVTDVFYEAVTRANILQIIENCRLILNPAGEAPP